MTPPSNNNDHLIEVPIVAGRWSHLAQVLSDRRTKLPRDIAERIAYKNAAKLFKRKVSRSLLGKR